ncbi:rRNA pseudouridine synthase [bacterium]|nr:rRNA pseudouridine synthase [bacterium]
MRLAKYLSSAGVASRRSAEKLIVSGRISVNKQQITDPACDVQDNDRIEFDGEQVEPVTSGKFVYLMLHKPTGIVSTMSPDKEEGACISDLVNIGVRLHPIGRLDRDTSGLILLTNDGQFTYRLTHPKHLIQKEYHVRTNRILTPHAYRRLMRGITIDKRVVKVDEIVLIARGKLSVTIHEGRKRIIRRLFEEIGHKVIELKRVRIGAVGLGRLAKGKWRKLNEREIMTLKGQ